MGEFHSRHSRHSTDTQTFQAFHRFLGIAGIPQRLRHSRNRHLGIPGIPQTFQAFHRHSRHSTLRHSRHSTDTQTFHRHSDRHSDIPQTLRHSTDTQTFQAFHKHSDFTGIPHSDILHIPQSLRHSTHSTTNQTVTKQIYYFHSESFNCHFVSFAIGAYHKNVHTFCIIPLKLVFSLFSVFFLPFVCLGLWYTIFLTACMALLILFMWLHLFFFFFSSFQVSVASSVTESRDDLNFSGAGTTQLVGKQLIPRQMISLLLKRLHHVRRSKKGFISEVSQGSRSLWLQHFRPPLLIHCRC